MPFIDLTLPPDPPQRTDDPETFAERADEFVVWMAQFGEDLDTFIGQLETAAALIAAAPAYADPGLVALAGNTPSANKVPFFTGAGSSALADFTAAARTLVAAADAAGQRTAMGLGSAAIEDAAAFDPAGTAAAAVGALTGAGDPFPQYLLEAGVSAFIATLLDDSDAATALATLGISASGNSISVAGKVIKWGTGNNGSNSFATPFPTQCDVVVYSLAGLIGESDEADEFHWVSSKSASGFTISTSGDFTSFPSLYYIAIGS